MAGRDLEAGLASEVGHLARIVVRHRLLDKSQAISIINKYDKISKTDIGKRLIKELGKIPERFLETPLLVGLLYKTFGFNNSIATNTAVFYSEIFDALYKGHDLTKSGYTRDKKSKLEINKFREIIRAFAFFYLAEADIKDYSSQFIIEIIEKSKRLCGCDQIISTDFFEDLLLAVPFLTKDGNNYKFMHRTIAEFFAAEFICSKDDPTKIILEILNSDLSSSFQKTLDFIAEISEQIYNKAITMKICEKFLGKYKSSYDTDYMSETFLFTTQLIITEKNTNKLRQHISNIEDNGYEFFIFGGNQEKYLIFKYKRNLYAPYKALLQISDRITTNCLDISESLKVLEEVMENDKSYNITDRKIKALYTNSSFKKLMRASCELRVNDSHKANFGLGPIDVTKCKHIIDLSNNLEKRNKNLKSILNV